MRALTIFAVAALSGCSSSDPCAGKSGVCIGIHLQGSATMLDQLAITTGDPAKTILTPSPPKAFTLPARVALILPTGTAGAVHVACDGISQGQPVAHDEGDVNLVNGRATLTLTLDRAAQPGDDLAGLGGGDGGGDMTIAADLSACAMVTTCTDGDGCCPVGCNNSSDHDCPAVCGNGMVETGETCDDGNTVNGDACDPTCHWANVMTTLSGLAGSAGYADGPDSRFGTFGGMTSDANNVYLADTTTATLRMFPLIAPSGASLYAGAPYDSRLVNGAIAGARFVLGGGNGDMVIIGGTLYIVDFDRGGANVNVLRSVGATVATVTGVTQPQVLATDGTNLYFVDNVGNVNKWVPGQASSTAIATAAAITTALGSSPFFVGMTYYNSALYLTVYHGIIKITTAGAVSLLTGSLDASKAGCANGTLAATTWGQLGHLTTDGGGNLYAPDASCCAIRYVPLISGSVGTYAGVLGSCGNLDGVSPSMAKFAQPTDFVYRSGGASSYVLDNGNNTVRIIPSAGFVTSMGSSPGVHSIDVYGTAASSRFTNVAAMVSDGVKIYALGGSSTTKLFTVLLADGSATATTASWTTGTAITKIGAKLYVGVSDGTIHSVNLDGTGDTVVAGMAGATYPPSDGTPGTPLSAVLNPSAFATDGTDLYFLDKANLVRKLAIAAGTVTTIAGSQGSTDIIDGTGGGAHFAAPSDLALAGGALYTLDGVINPNMGFTAPITVRRITLASREVATIAGQVATIGGNDGVGLAAQFAGALHLTTDGISLFIGDGDESYGNLSRGFQPTIRQLTLADTKVTTMIGTRGEWTIHNGTGMAAFVHQPGPFAFDPTTHTILFFDRGEGVFQRIR